jgi:DNA-binding CsgD family transcriptional regulator
MESQDQRLLGHLKSSLAEVNLQYASALVQLKEPIYRLLRSELFIYYGLEITPSSAMVSTLGGESEVAIRHQQGKHLVALPMRFQEAWPGYNPISVDPALQNQVSMLSRPSRPNLWERHDAILAQVAPPLGLEGYDQIRALLCDGSAFLYWIGGMRPEKYTEREVRLLEEILPHLQKRLRLERALRGAPDLSMLAGVLSGFGSAAFLLGAKGNIECCNELGARLYSQERASLKSALSDSLRGQGTASAFEVTPIAGASTAGCSLAVQRNIPRPKTQALAAARRWSLTPRQTEVLGLLVQGQSNWQIAASLGCAERTIEIHVGTILRRAQVNNRATLISNVLTQD